ncbi:MAG: histidine kinase [Spirochaetales bacterium]|nr:histidine kinase [Spirochaetales bacterium]
MRSFFVWFGSIRRRVLVFSLGTVTLLGAVSFYSQFNAQGMLRGVWEVYQGQKLLLDIDTLVDDISSSIESYLAFKGSDSLLRFNRLADVLRDDLKQEVALPSVSVTSRGMRRNLYGLGEEFLRTCQLSVDAKRGREEARYSKDYEQSEKISGFLKEEVDQLSLEEFRSNLLQASQAYKLLGFLQLTNVVMLTTLLSLAVLISFWFSRRLTEPLDSLALAAMEIARGNYLVQLPPPSLGETGRLTEAFHKMRLSIMRNIEEIQRAAQVEKENLRMKTLLKNAEFQALQAQINPHFLFNTLNAAGQLALIEDAPRTGGFLQSLAKLMRHNIRKLDQPVSLAEEFESLANYIYVARIRFGDRIRFVLEGVNAPLPVLIPPMTLQPLVENSILHGFQSREAGGTISIKVFKTLQGEYSVVLADDGEGMDPKVLQQYLDDDVGLNDFGGHSTGIGLGNVIHRLRLFYDRRDAVQVESTLGVGTRITLLLSSASADFYG